MTYNDVNNAANELRNTVKTIKIDNIDYVVNFSITVKPPATPVKQNYTPMMQSIENFNQNRSSGDNFVEQKNSLNLYILNGKVVAGGTVKGCFITMFAVGVGPDWFIVNQPSSYYYKLTIHEILHTMGLDDEGGIYFDIYGRMYYAGTRQNNYEMNDISNTDVANIIRYSIYMIGRTPDRDNNDAAVKINDPNPLTPNSVVTE